MDLKEAVQLALQGDERGYTYLYEQTYTKALYVAVKYMKNEENAYDVLQESYIKAFKSLGQLEDANKFVIWFHMIVSRTALNQLKKRTPMLFSQMESDDETYDVTNMFKDEYVDNQPELVLDQKETSRLIQEIINTLSDEQRLCVTMYYIDDFSVKEIAETIGVSENTVKSRLNYARKKIEEKVKLLEAQGTKLYGLAPLPFFILLMQKDLTVKAAGGISMQSYAAAMTSMGIKTKALGDAGAAATATAAKGMGLGTKIVIATVTATTVVTGGVFGYTKINQSKEDTMSVNEWTEHLKSEKAIDDYLSKQQLLTGKTYDTYVEDVGDEFAEYAGDSFFDGIVAHTTEDVDGDGEQELIVVKGEESGDLQMCLLKYDSETDEMEQKDSVDIQRICTDANKTFAQWMVLKGDKTYVLYSYRIGHFAISDGASRGYSLCELTENGIEEILTYYYAGTGYGVNEGGADDVEKVFSLLEKPIDKEQLLEIAYDVNFQDYLEGDIFGTVETCWEEDDQTIFDWVEARYEHIGKNVPLPDGWERRLKVATIEIK